MPETPLEKVISSKITYSCPLFRCEEAEIELSNGARKTRWYVVRKDAVMIVCVRNRKVLMLREYRSASQAVQWWLPAGGVEQGEDLRGAAMRETQEEAGLQPINITFFKSFPSTSAVVKQTTHCFFATQFKEDALPQGESEKFLLKVVAVPFDELRSLLERDEVPGSAGLALRTLMRKRPELFSF